MRKALEISRAFFRCLRSASELKLSQKIAFLNRNELGGATLKSNCWTIIGSATVIGTAIKKVSHLTNYLISSLPLG